MFKDPASLVRTLVLGIAFLNQFLVAAGKSPLPIADDTVEILVSTSFTFIASLWAWWKNNYISSKGKKQKEVLERYDLTK